LSRPGQVSWGRSARRSAAALTAQLVQLRARLTRFETDRRQRSLVSEGVLSLGRYTYGSPDVRRYPGDTARVAIGSFGSIAEGVQIFVGGNHPVEWVSTFCFRAALGLPGSYEDGCPASKGDVVVGHDVWIGAGATILSGVRVGNGAVIGARAVVAKDVRPYAVVVGNPARETRRRFTDEEIRALEDIAWWDWPLDRIVASVDLLSSPDLDRFLAESSNAPST
jgi:acetyltransferase-like isoleucine patch superfamily enzyme